MKSMTKFPSNFVSVLDTVPADLDPADATQNTDICREPAMPYHNHDPKAMLLKRQSKMESAHEKV